MAVSVSERFVHPSPNVALYQIALLVKTAAITPGPRRNVLPRIHVLKVLARSGVMGWTRAPALVCRRQLRRLLASASCQASDKIPLLHMEVDSVAPPQIACVL